MAKLFMMFVYVLVCVSRVGRVPQISWELGGAPNPDEVTTIPGLN